MKNMDSVFTLLGWLKDSSLTYFLFVSRFLSDVFSLKNLRSVFDTKLIVVFSILFCILYLPHAFILIEDIGLIEAYEVDPGSHIYAIEDILNDYNMHSGYHSKYYGWTFFAISFFVLMPVKIFCYVFGIKSMVFSYFLIRFILFVIGFMSFVLFHKIVKRLFGNDVLLVIASLFFILSPVISKFFYFIHPETSGILFLLAGFWFFLNFIEKPDDLSAYYSSVVFFVLATLSKQIFFFASVVMLFAFFYIYCLNRGERKFAFLMSADFRRIILRTAIIAFSLFFLIHPYAFFEPLKFIDFQLSLGAFVTSPYASSFTGALKIWYGVLRRDYFTLFFFVTLVPSLIFAILKYKRETSLLALSFVFNAIGIVFLISITVYGNRLYIGPSYLSPIYAFLIIHFLAVVNFIWKIKIEKAGLLKILLQISVIYFVVFAIFSFVNLANYALSKRLAYKDSVPYATYEYVKKNIVPSDRVAHDENVAIPKNVSINSCHYWRGCGNADYLRKYKPNYVMFNESFLHNGKKYTETENLKAYIKNNKMTLVKRIADKHSKLVISIYKK